MKLTNGIAVLIIAAGSAVGQQNPNILDNTRNQLNAAQQPKVDAAKAALGSNSNAKASQAAATTKPGSAKPAVTAKTPAVANTQTISIAPAAGKTKTAPVPAKPSVAAASAKAAPAVAKAADARASDVKSVAAGPVDVQDNKVVDAKNGKKEINFTGHRDPFVSPVVSRANAGSGCSTGKRCLAIDQINVRGVVKSDNGMIAVVTNALDKAYFLRENDPVFNGYVVKITGDSVVFKETFEDKLGKPLTREVTKKLTTPAV